MELVRISGIAIVVAVATTSCAGVATQTAQDQMSIVDAFVSKSKMVFPELEAYSDAQLGRWGVNVCSIALDGNPSSRLREGIASGELPNPETTGMVMSLAADSLCPDRKAALRQAALDYGAQYE